MKHRTKAKSGDFDRFSHRRETKKRRVYQKICQRGGGSTPLHAAAQSQDLDKVHSWIVSGNIDINALSDHKFVTALYIACVHGNLPIIAYLLQHGADINRGYESPLMAAIQYDRMDVLRYLVEHGADVNRASGKYMISPVERTIESARPDMTTYLLEHGADETHTHMRGMEEMIQYALDRPLTEPLCPLVLNYYSSDNYAIINEILLSSMDIAKYNKKYHQRMTPAEMDRYQRIIERMDQCFDLVGRTRPTDFVAYRGVRTHAKLRVGESMVLKNYTSTTMNVNRTRPFMTTTCCLYQFNVRKGVRFIDMKSFSHDPSEHEILLPRNVIMTYDGQDTGSDVGSDNVVYYFTISEPKTV
jgi:hypothetical protein